MKKIRFLFVVMTLLSVCSVGAEDNMSSEMSAVRNSQEFLRLFWTETATQKDFKKYEKKILNVLAAHPEDKGVADLTLATLLYSSRSKVIVNKPRAFELFKQAYAELPEGTILSALASYNVGACYYQKQEGLTQNFDSTYVYFSKAAEIDKRFKSGMGQLYEMGIGTKKDPMYALECFIEAAKAGGDVNDAYAVRYALENNADGDYVKNGYENWVKSIYEAIVNSDLNEAKVYLKAAADAGFLPAVMGMGNLYFIYDPDINMKEKGLQLYKKAADEGYIPAMYTYAMQYCYLKSGGASPDFDLRRNIYGKADLISYIEKAAEHGYAPAQHELGECYHYGIGVERDSEKAYLWYGAAVRQGYDKQDILGLTTKQQFEKMSKKISVEKKQELDKKIDEIIATYDLSAKTLDKGVKVTTVVVNKGEKAEQNQHNLKENISEDSWGY